MRRASRANGASGASGVSGASGASGARGGVQLIFLLGTRNETVTRKIGAPIDAFEESTMLCAYEFIAIFTFTI